MSLKDQLIKAAFDVLQNEVKKFESFLKKPNVLLALTAASSAILNSVLSSLKTLINHSITDADVLDYVRTDKNLQNIMSSISQNLDESLVSDVIIYCSDPSAYDTQMNQLLQNLGNNLSGQDYITLAQSTSDFNTKISDHAITRDLSDIVQNIEGMSPWIFLVYSVVLKMQEYLTQNEYPSVYRGKYLQRLIRTISAILNDEINNSISAIGSQENQLQTDIKNKKKQITTLLDSLKLMDAVIVASSLATFIYLQNRKTLQSASETAFDEIAALQNCAPPSPAIIPAVVSSPFQETTNCPVSTDDVVTPHIPFDDKLAGVSCEVQLSRQEKGDCRPPLRTFGGRS